MFPHRALFSIDVFALGLILAKLSLPSCNSLPVFPDDPRVASPLLTDQNKLYKTLGVTGAGQGMIEGMLKLSPDDRMTMQEAVREYQSIGSTAMHREKKQTEEKLAKSEKNEAFLQDQVMENLSLVDSALEKQQRAAADSAASLMKEMKKNL